MAAHQAAQAGPAAALAAQQERVRRALENIGPAGWLRPPGDRVLARLGGRGHFPEFPGELAWPPCDVAGHLRDSALIFAARIDAVRMIDRPYLVDFSTCDPARIARYRSVPRDRLTRELAAAQQRLAAAVARVTQADMAREACHEFDGHVALADMLAFLVGHQADHAEQLGLLA